MNLSKKCYSFWFQYTDVSIKKICCINISYKTFILCQIINLKMFWYGVEKHQPIVYLERPKYTPYRFLPCLTMSRIIYDETGTCRLTTDLWIYKRYNKRMYWMFNLWIQFYLYFASPYFGQNVLTDFEYHTNGISGTPRLNQTALKHNRKKDLGARLA